MHNEHPESPCPSDSRPDGPIRRITEEISVDAPTERVWAIVTDLGQMPGVHPQILSAHWLDGASSAALGTRFSSENVHADGVWRATSRIVGFVPGHSIAWTIEGAAAPPAVCRFDLVPVPVPGSDRERTLLRQTYFFDTRPGASPPVRCALAG